MRNLIAAGVIALGLASPALAQDMSTSAPASTTTATTPDGSKLFGFEPYFGVLGGYHSFDRRERFVGPNGERFDGALIEGLVGANLPLGPVFVGVEGFAAKGFSDINWEYGVRGRAGGRIGESGLIYGSVGYTWVDPKSNRGFDFVNTGPNDGVTENGRRKDWVYGLGVEVGPRDIGLGGVTGRSGLRLRVSAETYDLKSIRPMAGVIFHF
ncbi:outer membrane protein [Polymorphobacter fuscus]|uniref:Opacity protein n=1 Tax=Sandarakinorhabdus fusca TaxID=1439888 RepID=A0A7C9KMD7_9SPHN|nr:opacity protein [Polymorphobacter fuscus]KAB7646518.1 opacity protein [Polymorphobacter fuscus]MQT17763.1 opacity protein [Polymorphobacter fuscus]NJC09689.1 opacity protein-like surface antigen [Polymorphobacter fuscus]